MNIFKDGMTIKQLINALKSIDSKYSNKPVYISSDEEQNTLFKGFYVELTDEGLVLAGLSGCELDE